MLAINCDTIAASDAVITTEQHHLPLVSRWLPLGAGKLLASLEYIGHSPIAEFSYPPTFSFLRIKRSKTYSNNKTNGLSLDNVDMAKSTQEIIPSMFHLMSSLYGNVTSAQCGLTY